MKMKKLLLSLGTVAAVAAPVAVVVACSSDESTAIYTKISSIDHVALKDASKLPAYIVTLGNKVVINGQLKVTNEDGKETSEYKEFLVPSSYLKVTKEAAPAKYDIFGEVETPKVDATAELTDEAKKDKTLLDKFTLSNFEISLKSGEVVIVAPENINALGSNTATSVTIVRDANSFEQSLSELKDFREKKIGYAVDGADDAFYWGSDDYGSTDTSKYHTKEQIDLWVKDQDEAIAKDTDHIYVTLEEAAKLKIAYNEKATNADRITAKDFTGIMEAVRSKAIADYFKTIAAK